MRFQQKHYDGVFQVVATHGEGNDARTYTLCSSQGQRGNLGFSQPVAAERLTPVDILPMTALGEDVNTRICLHHAGDGREGTIVSQRLDSVVYISFDDDPDVEVLVDLTKAKYNWTRSRGRSRFGTGPTGSNVLLRYSSYSRVGKAGDA